MERFAKVVATLLVVGLFLTVSISRLPFTTVSPDSIRFMHFAQINADRALAEGGTATSAITAALRSIKGMNEIDYDRGRIVQGIMYGIDAMTRWMLPRAGLNLLMILVLAINAAMASRLATRDIADPEERLNMALLSWMFLLTTSLVISPVMLLTLYGKYVWVMFLLAHRLARRTGWKIFWLIPTAYSDEIGLIAAALVVFFHVGRMMLPDQTFARAEWRTALRAAAIAVTAAVSVLLVYFGISALIFEHGAGTFRDLGAGQLKRGVFIPQSLADAAMGVFWRAELILLGFSLKITAVTALIGALVTIFIGVAASRHHRMALHGLAESGEQKRSSGLALFTSSGLAFYGYWIFLFILISWLVLPGPAYHLNQYSYPAAIILGLLLVKSLSDLLRPRRAVYLLGFLSLVHVALIPQITSESSLGVTAALLPDMTVSETDIQRLHKSVEDVRTTGNAALLDSINNGQEIDFSMTWYYSRERWFGTATKPHWPVQGTVRVLAWPTRVPFKCVSRTFLYTKGEFVDKPCANN